VLAGGGALPRRIVESCLRERRPVFVIAFEGAAEAETVADVPHVWVRLGAVGRIIDALKKNDVVEVVLAGHMARPSWSTVRPDWRGMKMLPKVLAARQGDDSLLSLAIGELESEGFHVIGAHQILPDLLAPEGVIGRHRPDATAEADIARGIEVARALGLADVGQSVVVQQGIVLGVEAVEGTDALIARCGGLKRDGVGGVLVKCRKPQQTVRADLPSIGSATVAAAAAAGLRGLAVEANATLLVDREPLVRAADEAGLFIVGFVDGQ